MPDTRSLTRGETLFIQGETPVKHYMLQDGEIEILSAPDEFAGLDSEIIIDKSVRVGVFKGKAMMLGFSGNMVASYIASARAVSDCTVVEYPLPGGGFRDIAARDINGSINMLRQIFNNFMQQQLQLKKTASILSRMNQIEDNLLILYHNFSSNNGPESFNRKSEDLYSIFTRNNGKIPEKITADFVVEDKGQILKKSYSDRLIREVISQPYLELIKRILKLDPQTLSGVIKGDPGIAVSIFTSVASAIKGVTDNALELSEKTGQKVRTMFGESESWAEYFIKKNGMSDWNASGRMSPDFFRNLEKINARLDAMYREVSGKKIPGLPVFSDIAETSRSSESVTDQVSAAAAQTGAGSTEISAPSVISTGLQKSIFQIFEFSMIEKDFQNRMLKLLNDYKNIGSSASAESDARKMRRHIAQLYWELYQQVFVRTKSESSIPKAVKLMLTFGFLDEQLLLPEQVVELNDLARIRERETDVPILLEYEFLTKIYNGEEEPSITEMGLTYEAYIREQEKSLKRKDVLAAAAADDSDLNLRKTLHEISQRLKTTAAVCSGSTVTAFPILTADTAKGSLKNMYVSKSQLNSIAKKLIDIDYSLFYRETVLRMDSAREIIQEEVYPYIVLVPIAGAKSLLWQELSGNNKRSRGRFMVPILFNGDIERSLMHAFACFRWELNKNIKGAMWADPIEGGVTGEYFDYVNNFKKNNKLSQEMREKIALRFKSLRTNRDRFADDYMLWVEYEREGIMKLNSVVREMFFKHIPFRGEIRDNLENMPAFNKYATRYKNISAREFAAYERKFKKYQNDAGEYPKEIQTYFEFLKM